MRLGWVHCVSIGLLAGVMLGMGSPRAERMPELRVPESSALREAVLHRVVDGDSVEVFMDGRVHRLELSGVDAPEIREGLEAQRGAEAARGHLGLMTTGEDLRVMLDPRRSMDAAGRLNGYLYRAPELTLVNLELVRLGLAKHPRDPGGWNERAFAWANAQAQSAGKGLWDPEFGVVAAVEAGPALDAADVPAVEVGEVLDEAEDAAEKTVDTDGKDVVWVTKSGTKYHAEGCRHVRSSGTAVARSEMDPDLEPCKVCDPDGGG